MLLPGLGLDSASPGSDPSYGACQGSETCLGQPDLANINEDGSLLQVERSSQGQKAQTDTAMTGSGCPTFQMSILEGIVSTIFNNKIQDYFPFHVNHNFVDKEVSYKGCTAKVTATVGMEVNGDLQFQGLECTGAQCAKSTWGVCQEYNPLNASATVGATSLSVEAYLTGNAEIDASCVQGSARSIDFKQVKATFDVVNPKVEIGASVDFTVLPKPEVSAFQVSDVNLKYDKIDHSICAFEYCIDPESLLNTDELKLAMSAAVEHALDIIRNFTGDKDEGTSLSLEQVTIEHQEQEQEQEDEQA